VIGGGLDGPLRDLPQEGLRGQSPRSKAVVFTRVSIVIFTLALSLVLAGAVGAAYEEIEVKDGGVLSGVVRFAGAPPRLEPLRVNKNREVCGDSKESEALIVGAEGGVRGSVILVEGVTRGKKAEGELTLDNHRCLFVPHVSALMMGTRARVRNSDSILHNTHGFHGGSLGSAGKQTVFNLALPTAGQVIDITRKLGKPGPIRVLCDAHPHMFAWVYIHDSPYVAVTGERGAYRIEVLPPGTYRVTMWHEGFRPKGVDKDGRPLYDEPRIVTREVTIAPKAMATVDFELR